MTKSNKIILLLSLLNLNVVNAGGIDLRENALYYCEFEHMVDIIENKAIERTISNPLNFRHEILLKDGKISLYPSIEIDYEHEFYNDEPVPKPKDLLIKPIKIGADQMTFSHNNDLWGLVYSSDTLKIRSVTLNLDDISFTSRTLLGKCIRG